VSNIFVDIGIKVLQGTVENSILNVKIMEQRDS